MTGNMQCFSYLQTVEKSFFEEKNVEKRLFFIFIDPYRTRPGTGKKRSLHVTPSVKITPKSHAKIASLTSSIAFGDLRLGGCLRGPPPQAPARAQSPTRNTRIKRRKSRKDFVGYFDVPGSRVFTSEFTVRAL